MTNNFFKKNYTAVLGFESRPRPQKVAGLDLDQTVDSLVLAQLQLSYSSHQLLHLSTQFIHLVAVIIAVTLFIP